VESFDERVSNKLDHVVKCIFKLFCSQERFFDTVNIVLVGKYTDLKDSYMSVIKALEHSAFRAHRKLNLQVCSRIATNRPKADSVISGLSRLIWSLKHRSQIPRTITMHGGLWSVLGSFFSLPYPLLLMLSVVEVFLFQGVSVPEELKA
jgi:hypothetical protein